MKSINDKHIILFIALIVLMFLASTRTLTSGFHFVDDHEVIRIKDELKSSSVIDVSRKWIIDDIKSTARFRPLYFIHRVFETRLFGSDFLMWSVYTAILCFLALAFFYLGIRNLNFSIVHSLIFLITVFLGPQAEIWWRLGPQETSGMPLLAVSFFFLSKSLNGKKYHLNNILFITFLILASLCKESFILIVPAFLVLKVWYETKYLWKSFKEGLIKNLVLLIPLGIILIEVIYIKYSVGIINSGLHGDIITLLNDLWHAALAFIETYYLLLISGIIILLAGIIIHKRMFKIDSVAFMFFILILLPNLFLYSRTGLVDRYLLPSTLGLAFFIVISLRSVSRDPLWLKKLSNILVLISFLPFLFNIINDAARFSKEGRSTGNFISSIISSYTPGTDILVVIDPVRSYEASISLKYYLDLESDITLFGYCLNNKEDEDEFKSYNESWKSYFAGNLYENLTSAPEMLLFLDNQIVEPFFATGLLNSADYRNLVPGSSANSVLKLVEENY